MLSLQQLTKAKSIESDSSAAIVTRTSSRALQQTLFSLLQSSNTTISKLTQIHTQIIINGFTQKNFILVKLISWYTSLGYLQHANEVFKRVESPSTTLCNQVHRAYAGTHHEPYRSIQLSTKCKRPLTAGGDNGVTNARKVLDEMGERNVVTWNTLLAGCVRRGDFDAAYGFFDGMWERNVVSWTIMIAGFAQNGRCKQALSWFREMKRARVGLNQVTLVAALSACADIGNLNMGKWIHSYVDKSFFVLGRVNGWFR